MLLAFWLVLAIDLQIKISSIHDVKTACAPDKGLVAHIHIYAYSYRLGFWNKVYQEYIMIEGEESTISCANTLHYIIKFNQ